MKAATHLATVTRNTEKSTKNGEIKREKIIKETTKWIVTTSIGESGVVSVISAIVWFGIGAICGAIILVSFSAITYDERVKKKAYKEMHKADEELLNSDWGELEINEKQEKEREKDDNNGVIHK
jgi:uncharacterized protein HemY